MKHWHLFSHSTFSFSFATLFILNTVLWEVKAEAQHSDDYKALSALYQATNGDNWRDNANWITNSDVCTWENVYCNEQSRVNYVYLWNNNLSGSIPAEISLLAQVNYLYLRYNESLRGSIPTEIGLLSSLQYLDFSVNALVGSMPSEIGKLVSLERLYLDWNSFSGTLPTEIGLLRNLSDLVLNENNLWGTIPLELALLESLQLLDLRDNELTGTLPTEFGDNSNLSGMYLSNNLLTGSISAQDPICSRIEAYTLFIQLDCLEISCECCKFCDGITATPTRSPTRQPTTKSPTIAPMTSSPKPTPTLLASAVPSNAAMLEVPSLVPSQHVSKQESKNPSSHPTNIFSSKAPTMLLTISPNKTQVPSINPETMVPTIRFETPPVKDPTASSSNLPTASSEPSSLPTITLPVSTNVSLPSSHETDYNNVTRFMEYLRTYDVDLMNYLQNKTLSEANSVSGDSIRRLAYSNFEIANVTSSLLYNQGVSCNTTAPDNQCYQIDTEVNVLHHPKLFTTGSVKVMVTRGAIDFINVRGTFDGAIPIDVQADIEVVVTGVQNTPMNSNVISLFEKSIVDFLNQEIASDIIIDAVTLLYQTLKEPQATLEGEDPIYVATSVLLAGVNITGAYIPPPEIEFDEVIIDTFDEDNEIFVDILVGTQEVYFQNVSKATATFINESDKDEPFGELGVIGGSVIIAISALLCLSLAIVALYRNKKRLDFIEGRDDHIFLPDDSTQNLRTGEA